MPDDHRKFVPHPMGEDRRRSIAQLIRILIAIDDPLVLDEQKLQVIDTLLWKFTEADGKHKTPFRSVAALGVSSNLQLRHDHVATREQLKHLLIKSRPEQVDFILQEAVGCLVTIEEHDRLPHDRQSFGWQRYEEASIPWVDLRKAASSTTDH